jgi:hypothetical protein
MVNEPANLAVQVVLTTLSVGLMIIGANNCFRFYSSVKKNRPQLWLYFTSLACLACCVALDWMDMSLDSVQYMFAMCNLLETGFLWCQLLNFELIRKAFDKKETHDLETAFSGD